MKRLQHTSKISETLENKMLAAYAFSATWVGGTAN
jgi:hypothetical protein